MAQKKKNGAAEKNKDSKSNSTQPKKPQNAESAAKPAKGSVAEPKNEKNQFWSVVLFAIGTLVLLMSVIEGTSGWNGIHNVLLGLFGAAVFFVPIILIYTSVLIGMEKSQKCVTGRAIWGIALTFLISSVIQIVFIGEIPGKNIIKMIARLYSDGKQLRGGGVASIILAGPLLALFGGTGAKIISGVFFSYSFFCLQM